jgi:glycosyltransferase involved in cell wall biosynthesis
MKWPQLAPTLLNLQKLGGMVQQRPHYSSRLVTRLARRIRYALWDQTLEKSLAAFRPDVICVSQGGNFDLADLGDLRRYLLSSSIPYCLICHNYDASRLPPLHVRQSVTEAYLGAARVYFVSSEQARVSLRQLAHTFDNIEVVQNPVNIAEPQLLPWPPAAPAQLAIVGGLHIDYKGQDLALEVLSQPKWQQRDWHLNLYGEGYDREYIQELVKLYGLTSRVTLHGYCTNVQQLWQDNHLLLLPSRREAAPLVVMEAMLNGRPVVATGIGTIPEWVQPGVTGFVAAAATGPLFDIALEQAWLARAEWPALGRQAFSWASKQVQVNPVQAMLTRLIAIGKAAH